MGPQQNERPRQSEEPPAIEGRTHESCCLVISLKLPSDVSTRSTIFEIAQLLVDYYDLSFTFSDVCTAHMLSLTMPVTVATFERLFLKLKLIKNYTKYHIYMRLSDLAMWLIEYYSRKFDTWKVVDIFVHEKARKRTFQLFRLQTWHLFNLLHCFFFNHVTKPKSLSVIHWMT